MTVYELIDFQKKTCIVMAREYYEKKDFALAAFYLNASKGFESRMKKLEISEARRNAFH